MALHSIGNLFSVLLTHLVCFIVFLGDIVAISKTGITGKRGLRGHEALTVL